MSEVLAVPLPDGSHGYRIAAADIVRVEDAEFGAWLTLKPIRVGKAEPKSQRVLVADNPWSICRRLANYGMRIKVTVADVT